MRLLIWALGFVLIVIFSFKHLVSIGQISPRHDLWLILTLPIWAIIGAWYLTQYPKDDDM